MSIDDNLHLRRIDPFFDPHIAGTRRRLDLFRHHFRNLLALFWIWTMYGDLNRRLSAAVHCGAQKASELKAKFNVRKLLSEVLTQDFGIFLTGAAATITQLYVKEHILSATIGCIGRGKPI